MIDLFSVFNQWTFLPLRHHKCIGHHSNCHCLFISVEWVLACEVICLFTVLDWWVFLTTRPTHSCEEAFCHEVILTSSLGIPTGGWLFAVKSSFVIITLWVEAELSHHYFITRYSTGGCLFLQCWHQSKCFLQYNHSWFILVYGKVTPLVGAYSGVIQGSVSCMAKVSGQHSNTLWKCLN